MPEFDFEERLLRLEATEEIRQLVASYREFWQRGGPNQAADVAEPAPIGEFLARMRRGASEKLPLRVR